MQSYTFQNLRGSRKNSTIHLQLTDLLYRLAELYWGVLERFRLQSNIRASTEVERALIRLASDCRNLSEFRVTLKLRECILQDIRSILLGRSRHTSIQVNAFKKKRCAKSKRTKLSVPRTKKGSAKQTEFRWRTADIKPNEQLQWEPEQPEVPQLPKSVTELFELFYDDAVIDLLCSECLKYASSKGKHGFRVCPDEMKVFLGIFLVSGYSGCKRKSLYWSGEDDVRNEANTNAMARDRFDEIMRYFHIADNSRLDQADKFYKVRPLMKMLNARFQKHFLGGRDLSVDENMVQYFGKHEVKQFISGKPIRYGYKMWVLATPLGYVVNMVPYQGATGEKRKPCLVMRREVVKDLVSVLLEKSIHITFDNLFSSLTLVEELTTKGLACTGSGTIRANCTIGGYKTARKAT
ncbi:PiggyBac transposable element-derived protein 3 [Elysia marginata]|uniref:PiggyBac transposable element-derived protein 3 n=1 Tax=Elysia marginata TaxID=1093978 RepID=A0AAV4EJB0_9GAST|nr:PiggyBac transposable element-derived protein 3 [Elysia marginata]